MSNFPTMPALPPPPPEESSAEPGTTRNNKMIAGVGMAVLVALGVGIFAGTWIDTDEKPSSSSSTRPSTVDTVEQPDFEPEVEAESTYVEPKASDFTVELKVKSKQCFGSAGCNVEVEPELSYEGLSAQLDPEITYEITYQINGGDSGPVVETLELTDQDVVSYEETLLSTSASGVEPKAKVIDLSEY